MCIGAMLQARIKQLVYGATDEKGGATGSLYNLAEDERFNHQIEVESGVLAEESSQMLKDFFRSLRG
jgi:tRNA(adenine34) deaminase